MSNEQTKKKALRKKLIVRLIILVIELIILLYFYYLFFEFGANPIIIVLVIILVFLTTISPFLRRNKRSLYSRMFPNRKANLSQKQQRRKEFQQSQPKIFKPINLDINYRKPIINKCENCGNIVPNFVKVCPFCKHQILH